MTISKRHHYIPRFLIKNFSDNDNLLWVYNKEENRVLKTKQSSKSIFFEWGRNIFPINGELGDNVEKMYAETDDLLAKTVEKVLSTQTMTGREQTLIIFLVSLMKWRVPKSDNKFYDLVKDIPIENLGLSIRPIDNAPVDEHVMQRIQKLDIVNETKRLLLSVQPLMNEDILDEIHKNCFIVSHDENPALLGDYPIIEAPNTKFETLEDFIFPLGTSDTFICKRGAEKYISHPLFYTHRDLTTFHLSTKYVACKSKDQLLKIAQLYSKIKKNNKTDLLMKYVFEFIK